MGLAWRGDTAIAALTLLMIALFHQVASEDRLLLNLYYIGIAASAYALVKRHALVLTVVVISVAGGTTVGNVYMHAAKSSSDPYWDATVNFFGWCVLLLLCWRLAVDAYRLQSEEHRRRVERQIDEKALATRAAALTCTSHEVRAPLAAILTIAESLLDESAGPLTEVQREFLQDIDRCGKHLLALVNDMLDYAKAQAGQVKLALQSVDLNDLLEQCVTMAEARARENEVKLSSQIEAGVSQIWADPLRMKQIILNLLFNAVKFTPKGGMVKLHVRARGPDVLVSVRDTGRGISEQQLKNLFDPYQQAAQEDRGIGTGLGLAIVKFLAELHGGDISVESSPGCGSLFTVRVPAARKDTDGSQATWDAIVRRADAKAEHELCNTGTAG
jgi:signal transduction histidine kinase